MSRVKRAGLVLLAAVLGIVGFFAVTTQGPTFRDLEGTLGTTEEPLQFMARSVRKGMTRAEVAKIIRYHYRLETRPADHFCPGGQEVYHYHLQAGPRWRWLGEYGTVWVCYDAQGLVDYAAADLHD